MVSGAGKRMSKVLFVDPKKCTGCRTCELVCSFTHTKEFNPLRSRVSVITYEKDGFSFPAVCQQCSVAACQQVCPVGAIRRDDETGAMIVNHATCLRCKMCTIACPFGATFYDPVQDIIMKCDLCGGDPECVKNCPNGALTYREATSATLSRRKATANRMKEVMEEVQ